MLMASAYCRPRASGLPGPPSCSGSTTTICGIDYIVVVDLFEPCQQEEGQGLLYRLLLEAAGSTGRYIPEEIKDQLDQIATTIHESADPDVASDPEDRDEYCDECGAEIPERSNGKLHNKHHQASCSLYDPSQD